MKNLKHLKILWLADNECSNKESEEEYRLTVIRNLPTLVKLDNLVVTKEEIENAKNIGRLIDEPPKSVSDSKSLFETNLYDNILPLDDLQSKHSSQESLNQISDENALDFNAEPSDKNLNESYTINQFDLKKFNYIKCLKLFLFFSFFSFLRTNDLEELRTSNSNQTQVIYI